VTKSSRCSRLARPAVLGVMALAVPAVLCGAAESNPSISVFFETQLPYYYQGDPLPVAVTVKNVSERTVDNSKGLDLLGGTQVEDARGVRLKPAEGIASLITQPKSLEKSAFFGRILMLNEIFPALQKPGNYKMSWKGEGTSSNELILHVVERYDPKKDYRAKIETDFGPIVIEFEKEASPRHVRNFIDLTRQGFYNGNQFHRILPGVAIVGGSPTGDPAAGAGYNLDPEISEQPLVAGTVVQVRNRQTGEMDSGAHFMILAIAKADLRGRATVLGHVVEGLDTVKTICQVPTLRETTAPVGSPARPVKPVLIRRITLSEVTAPSSEKAAARKSPTQGEAKKKKN
jgi:cyclophilin family peptidyl-prolyl cis-trans isomerase